MPPLGLLTVVVLLPGDFRRDLLGDYDRVAEQVLSLFRPFARELYRSGVRRF